eukprot:324360_1
MHEDQWTHLYRSIILAQKARKKYILSKIGSKTEEDTFKKIYDEYIFAIQNKKDQLTTFAKTIVHHWRSSILPGHLRLIFIHTDGCICPFCGLDSMNKPIRTAIKKSWVNQKFTTNKQPYAVIAYAVILKHLKIQHSKIF